MSDERSAISAIEEKMAQMRLKNLELLRRHQEIEEDRQQAGERTPTKIIKATRKNRPRTTDNPPVTMQRRKANNAHETQPSARTDLKRERTREQQTSHSNRPELIEYAYPFHSQSKGKPDADEPAQAKKLVIVNNQAARIGSGRFQEQGQRQREERMRRCAGPNPESQGGSSEFHLDIPSIPIWHNSSITPVHVQLLPHHHPGMEHLINSNRDQMEQAGYLPNYMYSSAGQFNGNGPIYFAHPPGHFHPFHGARTFENSTRQPFAHFPPSNVFLQQAGSSSMENVPRFRPDHSRPISGEFERPGNSAPPRANQEPRFPSRPKSSHEYRYPSLPLSAYMNAADPSHSHEKQWNSSYPRRRATPQRPYNPDKHQFPLSSYDPRQYGFSNHQQHSQRRHEVSNAPRRPVNNTRNEIDLIEEWWEDDNTTELIGSKPSVLDDSGHSSLSASLVNISESTSNDAPHSTTDNNILQSLAHLQEQLQLEEAVDQCLTADDQLLSSMKESGTYNTAHFMQWAKKKFREELAGRLTAQEIQQHDAVTKDNDEEDTPEHDSIDLRPTETEN